MAEAAPRFAPFLDGLWDASTQVQQNVYRRTAQALAAGRAANDLLLTPHDVRRRQEELRRIALDALGGDLPQDRPVPVARRTGSVRGDGHRVDRLIVDVGDGVHIPANLYLPDDLSEPAGAVLFLCGHAPTGKAAPRYQAMCARLARAGLITLSFDTIGQGERKSYLDASGREIIPANVPEHSHAGVQCWWTGDSLARYFVSDARRMLDYLSARPEVDPRRVGVMGNSGGGTLTTWLMLVEPRLAAAAPSCFVSSREDYQRSGQAQDPEQIIPGGTLLGLDHEDFLLAMAPRPTLVMSANYDFFPVEGAVRTVTRGRRFYEVLGSRALEHVRADGGHGLSPELAAAATAFFRRHLGRAGNAPPGEPAAQPDEALQCTVSGQISTDLPGSAKVFDLNMRRLAELDRREAGGGLPWLRSRVEAGREPGEEFYPRWWDTQEPGVRKAFWWAEHDIVTAAVVFDPSGPASGVDLVLLDRGTDDLPAHAGACRRAARSGRHVVVVDVRASGALTPHRLNEFDPEAMYGTTFKLVSDLIGLSDSLGAARVYDVLRAVDFVRSEPGLGGGLPVRLVGAGQGAFLARLAGALDPGVAEIVCLTPALDPAELVRTRFYGPERDHQSLIPGMAHHCPKQRIDQALGARLSPGERWLTGEPLARVPGG
ncbi:acetylxylan esterase [Nonomuraea sp. NPDC050663]|uniref:alpha/beta hydrolase family protein n=1 Tax=Nonomuraea sp. NPDC050663 TaxID=3364370 RepID=UPI00379DACF6